MACRPQDLIRDYKRSVTGEKYCLLNENEYDYIRTYNHWIRESVRTYVTAMAADPVENHDLINTIQSDFAAGRDYESILAQYGLPPVPHCLVQVNAILERNPEMYNEVDVYEIIYPDMDESPR